jgi:hypothetical protein
MAAGNQTACRIYGQNPSLLVVLMEFLLKHVLDQRLEDAL